MLHLSNVSFVDSAARYLEVLENSVPDYIYEGLFSIAVITLLLCLSIKGYKKGIGIACRILLIMYVFLIYCSTIIFRERLYKAKYSFSPFRSYCEYLNGKEILLYQNIMNVVVFVPIGMLACIAYPWMKWWKIVLWSCGLSVSIELLQYIFHKGFSEVDDVIHNTLGCLVGVITYKGLQLLHKRYALWN